MVENLLKGHVVGEILKGRQNVIEPGAKAVNKIVESDSLSM